MTHRQQRPPSAEFFYHRSRRVSDAETQNPTLFPVPSPLSLCLFPPLSLCLFDSSSLCLFDSLSLCLFVSSTFPPLKPLKTDIFSRVNRLLGDDATALLSQKKVILFGVGGVGSWCAEALVRTGITHLTIVDADKVQPSNINRQLMATTLTVGEVKVDALRKHLLTINPEADVRAIHGRYDAETADTYNLNEFDYVVDAIDSLADKALLIRNATRSTARLFSSMGAALKLDPTRIAVAEFWKVKGCPLAAALRRRFKKEKNFPARKFLCVFSDELLQNRGEENPNEDKSIKSLVNGSLIHITAIFGFTLGGLIIQDITKRATESA